MAKTVRSCIESIPWSNKREQTRKRACCSRHRRPLSLSFKFHLYSPRFVRRVPPVCRLQAWATVLAKEKRSLVCEIKARAPAEIVGAHLRFLSRTGTWERLLLDLNKILESAVSQREQAVGLLSEQVAPETRGASGHGRTTHCESVRVDAKREWARR